MRFSAFALMLAGLPCLAATPLADLAVPPGDAQHFTILSTAGKHGDSYRWVSQDGRYHGRESIVLRGQVFETDSDTQFGADHMIAQAAVRGFTPNGDAGESFAIDAGRAHWKSPVDAGEAPYANAAMYVTFGGPVDTGAVLLEQLLAAPGRKLALLPGGQVQAEPLTTLRVGKGASQKTIVAYAVTGLSNTPFAMWADDKGKFFAQVGGLSWLPAGYETEQPRLEKAQDQALSKRSPKLYKQLLKTPATAVAFTNVRAFVDGDHFAEGQTVLVDKGVIRAVGPVAEVALPKAVQKIDGTGKTLVPGLWDAHMHVGDDASGPMLLSLGITSARDPGNVNDLTLARAKRRAAAQLLMPHVYPSVLMDGKGPNTAQVASVATSLDEALAIVRKAKAQGFKAIKFYGTYNPAWVAPAAAEAHRLGLHVHGHLPAGMRPLEAINSGYDEITHIYFVMMQAMPDSVVSVSNGMARFQGPGKYAKDMDLQAEPMKSLIATMGAKKITVDPTLVVAEGILTAEMGDLSPSYAPFVGTLPPAVERGFRQGGFVPQEGVTRADFRAAFIKMRDLVAALHKAGAPIVAGTDGSGMELVRELEIYVDAGFTPEQALASATITTAKLVGVGDRTGSIAVGKAADLVLVEGDPSKKIGDLRHTRTVMMDGKLMDADALRAAGGYSGRSKFVD